MTDIDNRVKKARTAFLKLKSVWSSNSISLATKLRLFKSLVKTVLMYGSETWKMNQNDNRKIDVLKISWRDHI